MECAVASTIALILVGLECWRMAGWVAAVVVTVTIGAAVLGMYVWSAIKASHRRRS